MVILIPEARQNSITYLAAVILLLVTMPGTGLVRTLPLIIIVILSVIISTIASAIIIAII